MSRSLRSLIPPPELKEGEVRHPHDPLIVGKPHPNWPDVLVGKWLKGTGKIHGGKPPIEYPLYICTKCQFNTPFSQKMMAHVSEDKHPWIYPDQRQEVQESNDQEASY